MEQQPSAGRVFKAPVLTPIVAATAGGQIIEWTVRERRGGASLQRRILRAFRVEDIPEAVAKQVGPEHGEHDGHPGKHG